MILAARESEKVPVPVLVVSEVEVGELVFVLGPERSVDAVVVDAVVVEMASGSTRQSKPFPVPDV